MATTMKLRLTRLEWMKIKRWYIQRNHSPQEIAEKLGVPQLVNSLSCALYRKGWTKIRTTRVTEIQHKEQTAILSDEEREELDKIDAFKDQSEELLEKSFQLGREAVDAKTLMQASASSKNYLDVYQRSQLMKSPETGTPVLIGVNLFAIGDNEQPAMKTAEPIGLDPITTNIGL